MCVFAAWTFSSKTQKIFFIFFVLEKQQTDSFDVFFPSSWQVAMLATRLMSLKVAYSIFRASNALTAACSLLQLHTFLQHLNALD